jgi:accessory gene regulator protein AgrB
MFGFIDCMHWGWKIVLLFGMKCTDIIKRSLQLYWKQLLLKTYGFGIHSLECLGCTMTSMFYNGHRYLEGLLKVKAHKSITILMVMIIHCVVI